MSPAGGQGRHGSEDRLYVTVEAGMHERVWCPVSFTAPDGLLEGGWELVGERGALNLDVGRDGVARFVVTDLPAGGSRRFVLRACEQDPAAGCVRAMTVEQEANRALAVRMGANLITRYVYAGAPARPYFHPLRLGDLNLTRAYPMTGGVSGETQDHPHHRSAWIAFGSVNGTDNWSEEPGHGSTIHGVVETLENGDASGRFATRSTWTCAGGEPILEQSLDVRVWATPPHLRLIDFAIDLVAAYGDVQFGDTKEGGILSVRVASSMDGVRGGCISNSYGAVGEAECWGRAAHWCDYSGMVGGSHAGIAILDHPLSFRYPSHWHVRDYGLMTANPFGYGAYTHGLKDGAHVLRDGATLPFRYRMILHAGHAKEAGVAQRYHDFVSPPRVTISRNDAA